MFISHARDSKLTSRSREFQGMNYGELNQERPYSAMNYYTVNAVTTTAQQQNRKKGINVFTSKLTFLEGSSDSDLGDRSLTKVDTEVVDRESM